MSSRDDLKKMLKQYSIPLKGLKNKQDYVQALLDSGWVQDFDQQMARSTGTCLSAVAAMVRIPIQK